MYTRDYALAHINRLQSYKKKLTYTIVYAIFLYFYAINAAFSVLFDSDIREHAYYFTQIIRVGEIAETGVFLVERRNCLHVGL